MAGIGFYQQLQQTLLNCGSFQSDRELAALFMDSRLYPWRNRVPQASSAEARVQATLHALNDQSNAQGENALVLLVQVLRDMKDPMDGCHSRLATLAVELAQNLALVQSNLPSTTVQPTQPTAATPAMPQSTQPSVQVKRSSGVIVGDGGSIYIYPPTPQPNPSPEMSQQVKLQTISQAETPVEKKKGYALVMRGGGAKGLAYVGALKELEKYYEFDCFAGTSAGAIAAILLAAGYKISELEVLLRSQDLTTFLDANFLWALWNGVFKGGLYEAKSFKKWVDDQLDNLPKKLPPNLSRPIKLNQLEKQVIVFASSTMGLVTFDSKKIDGNSNITAAQAARNSMSIPYLFVPQCGINQEKYYDGGLIANFPLEQFLKDYPQYENKVIGLYLKDEESGSHVTGEIFNTAASGGSDNAALTKYRQQIVEIDPSPISTLDFNLQPVQKEFLLAAGQAAALNFLYYNNEPPLISFTEEIPKAVNDAKKWREKVRESQGGLRILTTSPSKLKLKLMILWATVFNSGRNTLFIVLFFILFVALLIVLNIMSLYSGSLLNVVK